MEVMVQRSVSTWGGHEWMTLYGWWNAEGRVEVVGKEFFESSEKKVGNWMHNNRRVGTLFAVRMERHLKHPPAVHWRCVGSCTWSTEVRRIMVDQGLLSWVVTTYVEQRMTQRQAAAEFILKNKRKEKHIYCGSIQRPPLPDVTAMTSLTASDQHVSWQRVLGAERRHAVSRLGLHAVLEEAGGAAFDHHLGLDPVDIDLNRAEVGEDETSSGADGGDAKAGVDQGVCVAIVVRGSKSDGGERGGNGEESEAGHFLSSVRLYPVERRAAISVREEAKIGWTTAEWLQAKNKEQKDGKEEEDRESDTRSQRTTRESFQEQQIAGSWP
eukprot:gene3630-2565_t